jgi:hypothetical protein
VKFDHEEKTVVKKGHFEVNVARFMRQSVSLLSGSARVFLVISERDVAGLFGANAYSIIDRSDKHLAIACFTSASGGHDGIDGALDEAIGQDDFDLDFGLEVDGILAAAIDLHVAFLAAEPLDGTDGKAVDPEIGERFFDLFQLEWLNDGFDSFHKRISLGARGVQPVKPTGRATSGNSNMGKEECSGMVEYLSFEALRRKRDGRAGR